MSVSCTWVWGRPLSWTWDIFVLWQMGPAIARGAGGADTMLRPGSPPHPIDVFLQRGPGNLFSPCWPQAVKGAPILARGLVESSDSRHRPSPGLIPRPQAEFGEESSPKLRRIRMKSTRALMRPQTECNGWRETFMVTMPVGTSVRQEILTHTGEYIKHKQNYSICDALLLNVVTRVTPTQKKQTRVHITWHTGCDISL